MPKILYTASTDIHILNFHIPYIKWFKLQGYEVHVACNGNRMIPGADNVYYLPFSRNPIHKDNLTAYHQLKQMIKEHEYQLIHCHTPTCGVVTRLAAVGARRRGTKVLYTVHGFHFYKGSNFLSWMVFYPIECLLSSISDGVITMNNEDFKSLKNWKFRTKGKFCIDGIGVNPDRLEHVYSNRETMRKELGFASDDIVFFYIAEFILRKNHSFIFNSLKRIMEKNSSVKFMFAGGFSTEKIKMESIVEKNGYVDRVKFLGYQTQIGKYISVADVGLSSSKAEGLPIGISEMMFKGFPVIASEIRGHKELINHGKNGYLFSLNDPKLFEKYVLKLANDETLRIEMGENAQQVIQKFMIDSTLVQMSKIYQQFL